MIGVRKLIIFLSLAIIGTAGLTAIAAGPALAQDHVDRSAEFIQELATDGIGLLEGGSLDDKAVRDRFHSLFVDRFAVREIARFLLGRSVRGASVDEIKDYVILFEDVTVNQWSNLMTVNFDGQEIEVRHAFDIDLPNPNRNAAVVRTDIINDGSVVARVDWVVTSQNGIYKVTDVSVAGVSLLVTQRDEFAQFLQNNNNSVGALNEMLRARRDAAALGN